MGWRHTTEHEKAYQSQDAIFVARKRNPAAKKFKSMRWVKNVGLGIKTPDAAIEGDYVDKKCPFTGNVSIRGKILKGLVTSTKMKRTGREEGLPPLHQEIPPFREAPQEHPCPLQPLLWSQGRRYRDHRAVPPFGQDCQVQCRGA